MAGCSPRQLQRDGRLRPLADRVGPGHRGPLDGYVSAWSSPRRSSKPRPSTVTRPTRTATAPSTPSTPRRDRPPIRREFQGLLEFDLSGLDPTAAIVSATLVGDVVLTQYNSTQGGVDASVLGYAGGRHPDAGRRGAQLGPGRRHADERPAGGVLDRHRPDVPRVAARQRLAGRLRHPVDARGGVSLESTEGSILVPPPRLFVEYAPPGTGRPWSPTRLTA